MGSYWSREDLEEIAEAFQPPKPPPPPPPPLPDLKPDHKFVPTESGYKTYLDAFLGRTTNTRGRWIMDGKEKDEA